MPTASAATGAAALPPRLVLFDGDCGVCHRSVRWLLDADPDGRFHFAPLKGPTAAALRARHPELPSDLDSIVYVERDAAGEHVRVRADAVLRLLDEVGNGWGRVLRRLPRWVTDLGYRVFASNRHHVSRPLGACPMPTAAERIRFLP